MAHILLQEIGVTFEGIPARISATRSDFPKGFQHINPKMRVPVIVIDGETITEVPAIATAIANLSPERHLLGRTPLDTVRVYEWMNWLSGTLHGVGFGHLFRPQRWSNDPNARDGIKSAALKCIKECFGMIEEKLTGVYAVGGDLTVVDPCLFVFYRWGNQGGLNMDKEYPKYTALVHNLLEYPSVKATLEAEKVKSTL